MATNTDWTDEDVDVAALPHGVDETNGRDEMDGVDLSISMSSMVIPSSSTSIAPVAAVDPLVTAKGIFAPSIDAEEFRL